MDAILQVQELEVSLGPVRIVDRLSFSLGRGEVLGLVGESGSGKTITLKSILRLLGDRAHYGGRVLWDDEDILTMDAERLRRLRGGEIAMVFQEPMSALNPVLTIGAQIDEVLVAHTDLDGKARTKRAIELLDQVGIPSAASRLDQFPHEFSGGMRQRAMIATSLAGEPKLLLADEPTTALDVTIQDQILKLLGTLVADRGMAMILVTHDLGVVAETCDRVCIMYAGQLMESGSVPDVFRAPKHGYTAALLDSISWGGAVRQPLQAISGQPPQLDLVRDECPFAPRCKFVADECRAARPVLSLVSDNHLSACVASHRIPPARWVA